ncbi:hypothetical protein BDZ89DRAFT_338806 [Hymenopellis radicata]|nr:hypothetical protein BDZ89DRAFT_338806 [Hymenopellis radicata]
MTRLILLFALYPSCRLGKQRRLISFPHFVSPLPRCRRLTFTFPATKRHPPRPLRPDWTWTLTATFPRTLRAVHLAAQRSALRALLSGG